MIWQESKNENEQHCNSLTCEETYDGEVIKSAITSGKDVLISTLRTTNLYPPGPYTKKIAESVINIYSSGSDQSQELFFDDKDYISKERKKPKKLNDVEDEPVESDNLFGEEQAELDELSGEDNIKGAINPIKVAEDESNDIEKKS